MPYKSILRIFEIDDMIMDVAKATRKVALLISFGGLIIALLTFLDKRNGKKK